MPLARPVVSIACVVALVGCGEDRTPIRGDRLPITAAAITEDSVANVRTLAHALWTVQRWLFDAQSVTGFGNVLTGGDTADLEDRRASAAFIFLPEDELELEEALDEVEAFLRERAWTADQIESESATEVIYRLDPARLCSPDWAEDDLQVCRDVLAHLDVRCRVVSFAAGDLDVTVLVGAARQTALQLELHHDVASVELQIGPALEALQAIVDALGDADVPAVLAGDGALRLVVRRLTERQVRLSAEVTAPVSLTLARDDETSALALGLGSAALELDADAERATADLDLGRVALSGSKDLLVSLVQGDGVECWDEVVVDAAGQATTVTACNEAAERDPLGGTFAAEIGKVAAYFDLTDTERRLDLRGLVVGPAELVIDQQTVLEGTLDDGATALDFDLALRDDRTASIRMSRAADARLLLRLGLAADTFEGIEDSVFADEDLGIAVAGAAPEAVATDDDLVMTAGQLTLTSKHARQPTLVIDQGMCLWFPAPADVEPVASGAGGADPGATDDGADAEPGPHPFDLAVGATCPDVAAP